MPTTLLAWSPIISFIQFIKASSNAYTAPVAVVHAVILVCISIQSDLSNYVIYSPVSHSGATCHTSVVCVSFTYTCYIHSVMPWSPTITAWCTALCHGSTSICSIYMSANAPCPTSPKSNTELPNGPKNVCLPSRLLLAQPFSITRLLFLQNLSNASPLLSAGLLH